MTDLEIAESKLKAEHLSLIFIRGGRTIFQSREHGIKPFIYAIRNHHQEIEGSALADKIVGKATALLSVYSKVHYVYASVIGSKAANVLSQHDIRYKYGIIVENIVNRWSTDLCPFEKIVFNLNDPGEAYRCIEEKLSLPLERQ